MTALAQLLLVLTSLAPVGLVYAGILADRGRWDLFWSIYGAAFVLLVLCVALLHGAARVVAPVPMEAKGTSPKQGDSLTFLVAYALPLLTINSVSPRAPIGLCVFAAVVALVLWQQQIFHINPVLALLGFRFFAAQDDAGRHVMVITRRKTLGDGVLQVTRLSGYLWFEYSEPKSTGRTQGDARLSSLDTSGRDDSDDPR
jgi:hypothetical protein